MEGCKVKAPATTGEVQMMFLQTHTQSTHGALTTALPGAFKLSRIQRHTREAESRAGKKDAENRKVIKHKSRVTSD